MRFIKKVREGESYYGAIIGWKHFVWDKSKHFFCYKFKNWKIAIFVFTGIPDYYNCEPRWKNKIIAIW